MAIKKISRRFLSKKSAQESRQHEKVHYKDAKHNHGWNEQTANQGTCVKHWQKNEIIFAFKFIRKVNE